MKHILKRIGVVLLAMTFPVWIIPAAILKLMFLVGSRLAEEVFEINDKIY